MPSVAVTGTDDMAPYRAYGFLQTNGLTETCDVRRFADGTEVPEGVEFPYRLLMQVSYSGDEQMRLLLPDCIILLEGRGLTEIRQKLARRQVTFVQQYSRRLWPTAPNDGPVIERVEIIRPDPLGVPSTQR